jgi:Fe-coproporphyrin III synthase
MKVFKANFVVPTLPFKYFLVVTKSCGSRCTNCLIWKEQPENEMTLPEYEKLARNSGEHLHWLNISGGEPTDRLDLTDIIDIFIRNCPSLQVVNFTTNGLNFDQLQKATEFLDASPIPLIGLNVSIDGPPKLHDRLRGTPGGFEKAIRALKMIRKHGRVKSAAAMTLFPSNQAYIEETVRAIQEHIPDFTLNELHLNFPHTSDHYYGNGRIDYQERINFRAIKPLLDSVKNSLKPFDIVEKIYQRKLNEYIETGVTPIQCAALKSNIYISEKGDVYPCTIWDKKIGSLRETNFDLASILLSLEALKTIALIKQKQCPNCWTPCEAFPSIITDLRNSIWSIV